MKKHVVFRSIVFLLLTFLSDQQIQANPDPSEVKGTFSCLKDEYKRLSPVFGCFFLESPILLNMYKFGPQNDPVVRLIRKLFYLNNDGTNFNPMQNPQEIATYLDSKTMGEIIGVVLTVRDISKLEKTIAMIVAPFLSKIDEAFKIELDKLKKFNDDHAIELKTLVQELATLTSQKKKLDGEIKKEQQKISDFLDKENVLPHLIKEQEAMNNSQSPQRAKYEYLKAVIAQRINFLKTAEKKDISLIKKQLRAKAEAHVLVCTQVVQKEERIAELKKFHTQYHLIPEKRKNVVHDFVTVLQQAVHESRDGNSASYPLLAFVWAKSLVRTDLVAYFQGLESGLKADIFIEKFHASGYSYDDYKALKEDFLEDPVKVLNDYEKAIFLFFGFDVFEYLFPYELQYRNDVSYKHIKAYPNCGETSLLNWFNILMYDPVRKVCDPSLFLKRGIVLDEKVINFFKENYNPRLHASVAVHEAWGAIVSEIKGVTYKKDALCEISAFKDGSLGFKNMNVVVAHLTGGLGIKALYQKMYQAEKKELVSEGKHDLSFCNLEEDECQKNVFFIFKVNQEEFLWDFMSGHFIMRFPPKKRPFYFSQLRKIYKKDNGKNPLLIYWLGLGLGAEVRMKKKSDFLKDLKQDLKISENQYYQFLYAQDLSNSEHVIACMKNLVNDATGENNPRKSQLIMSLYHTLPKNDFYSQQEAAKIFLGVPFGIDLLLNYKKNKIANLAIGIAIKICLHMIGRCLTKEYVAQRCAKELSFLRALEFPPMLKSEWLGEENLAILFKVIFQTKKKLPDDLKKKCQLFCFPILNLINDYREIDTILDIIFLCGKSVNKQTILRMLKVSIPQLEALKRDEKPLERDENDDPFADIPSRASEMISHFIQHICNFGFVEEFKDWIYSNREYIHKLDEDETIGKLMEIFGLSTLQEEES